MRLRFQHRCCSTHQSNRSLQEERKWLDFFKDPSQWFDNRAGNCKNYPHFKNAATRQGIWIDSLHCPRWVAEKLKSLKEPNTYGLSRAQYKQHQQQQSVNTSSLLAPQDVNTFLAALKQCARTRDLKRTQDLHTRITETGIQHVYIESALVNTYSQCRSILQARAVFDKMVHRNVVSWNCLIRGYVVNGRSEEALEVFDGMEKAEGGCEPNARTYVAAISACAALGARKSSEQKRWLDRGKAIHNQAVTSGNCGVFVKSALINMYAKCGSMADARRVFDEMSERDIISWNCLMQGYLENGLYQTVLEVFDGIHGCVPDARTYLAAISACVSLAERKNSKTWIEKGKDIFTRAAMNRCCDMFIESAMVDMYAKTDCMKDARSIFDGMARRDIVSWNSLLHGYVENREAKLALQLYDEIHDSVVPDERTYLAVVAACASLGSTDVDGRHKWLKRGRDIHCQAVKTRFCDIFVENTLVDMYAQCESMLEARQVFDSMALWNIVSWNCLVGGYVKNGENKMALEIISAMGSHGFAPDPATYIAAFMACGNSMDVVRGKEYHEKIRECGFEKDMLVLTSLLEFYGNCGMIEVAKGIFDSMVVKDIWSWNALLSAYSQQGDTHSVLEVFKVMVDRGTAPNEFTFTLILNACSHAGLTEKGKELFDSMEAKYGVKPDMIHYNCLVDLLGRANLLEEAVRFVRTMPFEGNAVTWGTILGACRKWNNVEVARVAYEALLKFDVKDSSTYVLMANICGNAGGSCSPKDEIHRT